MTLRDTINLMNSEDYKERFQAEYLQTKIRYENLKDFVTRIEASEHSGYSNIPAIEMPKHDCPTDMLVNQRDVMLQYLHIMEVRAVIEGIDLEVI